MIKESSTVDSIAIGDIVVDLEAYPRADWSRQTADRYAEALEAGEMLPPITLERGTNRLLDGMHRYQAHLKLGRESIEVDYDEVPEGVPVKLWAASKSKDHGDRLSGADAKEVARETIHANPEFSQKTVSRLLGVTSKTVSKWVADITQRRKAVRKVKSLILSRSDWSQQDIADFLGVSQRTVSDDLAEIEQGNFLLTEDLLREAYEGEDMDSEEFTEAIFQIREELIFGTWTEEERELLERLRSGETVVVNMRGDGHPNLVQWTTDAGLFVRIDRRTDWGNPFELGKDGSRQAVVDNYDLHYLPHKPSLLGRLDELQGKALGCWCAPDLCHGHMLKARAER